MNQRRTMRLRPALEPLTPEPRPSVGEMTRDELAAQNLDLKRIMSAERRRHAAVEREFVKSLDGLQSALYSTRAAYFDSLTMRPAQSEKRER